MTTPRANCRSPEACVSKSEKTCSPCNLSALHRDPAFRAKRAAAFRDRLANDPEFRAKHLSASAESLAKWRASEEGGAFTNANSLANLKLANSAENTAKRIEAIRKIHMGWCPRDRWDEYRNLARTMPAAEAKRIILADIAAVERRRLASLSPFERQDERLARGAQIVAKPDTRRSGHAFTLGGVASGIDA